MSSFCCLHGTCKTCRAWRAHLAALREARGDVKYKRKPSPEKQNAVVDEVTKEYV